MFKTMDTSVNIYKRERANVQNQGMQLMFEARILFKLRKRESKH